MGLLVKQSTATENLRFLMVLTSDHITGATGLSPTVTISKNGAAYGAPAGAVTEISGGWYKVAANATDTDTLGSIDIHATAGTADPTDVMDAAQVVAFDPRTGTNLGLSALPTAAPGAANGLQIAGSNAATTFAALTVTGVTTLTGNMVLSDGLTISAPSTGNRAGLSITGNGTGAGAIITSGNGAAAQALDLVAASTNGHAFRATGVGTGSGINTTGGVTGFGILATAGATSGDGIRAISPTLGDGIRAASSVSGNGFQATGGGGSNGIIAIGGATGIGIILRGGATSGVAMRLDTTSGDALSILPTAGNGITITANGSSKHGVVSTGGTAGTSDGFKAVAGTGGVDFRGEMDVGRVRGSTINVLIAGRVDANTQAIGADVVDSTALAASAATEIATAVFARAFSAAYGSFTFDEMVKLTAAVLLGKASGLGTATATYRNLADSADVIVATVDADGNRTAVVRTP